MNQEAQKSRKDVLVETRNLLTDSLRLGSVEEMREAASKAANLLSAVIDSLNQPKAEV